MQINDLPDEVCKIMVLKMLTSSKEQSQRISAKRDKTPIESQSLRIQKWN